MQVQRNKAIVGQNAFAHEAGIHQDGMLKERSTYEIMKPEDVGIPRTELVLGKHSGRHALKQRVARPGLPPRRRATAARVRGVQGAGRPQEGDLRRRHRGPGREPAAQRPGRGLDAREFQLLGELRRPAHGGGQAPAPGRAHFCEPAVGDGPVDAVFKSIQRITGIDLKVTDYRVRSVTGGEDAQGEAQVEVEFTTASSRGRGVSTDMIEASALAFLQVINRIALRQVRPRLKPTDHVPQEVVPAA